LSPGDLFERCSFPAACLGAENKIVELAFIPPEDGFERFEKCSEGYLNPSRMCHACAEGYSHEDNLSGRCSKCPTAEKNIGAAIGGAIFGFFGLSFYLFISISDGGMKGYGDALKMIMLNYVQMIFLLTTFPIEWPEIFSAIFQVGGAISSLGEHFVNLKCLMGDSTDADVFYLKALAWSLIPLILCFSMGIFFVLAKCVCHDRSSGCWYRFRVGDAVQKWHVAAVAILYLLYPTLCTSSLSLFACRTVCDDDVTYLRADLEEKCFVPGGRHEKFAYFLGVPMIFLYVFGLPLAGLIFVWRLRRRSFLALKDEMEKMDEIVKTRSTGMEVMKRKSMQKDDKFAVYGILFSMFRSDTWYWECKDSRFLKPQTSQRFF
jgi:hypothetical protein